MTPPEDPLNVVSRVRLDGCSDEEPPEITTSPLTAESYSWQCEKDEAGAADAGAGSSHAARRKIHPLLEKWIRDDNPGQRTPVIVTFYETLRIPRFPDLDPGQPLDAPENKEVLALAGAQVAQIRQRRSSTYDQYKSEVLPSTAEVVEDFWLASAMEVNLPLGEVEVIAARREVQYVEPRFAGDEPPDPNKDEADDVIVGREAIRADSFPKSGGERVGLLDTGVRATHDLLDTRISFAGDCVDGDTMCVGGSPDDDYDHGTSTAAIVCGNLAHGTRFEGVLDTRLDSLKVYRAGFLDVTAAMRGLAAAVARLDKIILAEMQSSSDDLGALAQAADNAFDAGAVVIAANGNYGAGGSGTVASPASAHRVIGVGSVDVQSGTTLATQSLGPTADGRIKPDIQAPTNTETAGAASDSNFRVIGGTSGAAPYAAGAAAVLRSLLRQGKPSVDPGHVYAQLIVSGQPQAGGPMADNSRGCGLLALPTGPLWWGKVEIADGVAINVPLDVPEGMAVLDAALWWPESLPAAGQPEIHNDIDLYVLDPGGKQRAESILVESVFEKARVSHQVDAGAWTLQIHGYSVADQQGQTVYWAARAEA